MVTRKVTTRRGAGDPETRADWTKVLRYGHLRSAPVVVAATFTRGVGTAYAFASPTRANASEEEIRRFVDVVAVQVFVDVLLSVQVQKIARDAN